MLQLVCQGIAGIPHPSTSYLLLQATSNDHHTSEEQPPPLPPPPTPSFNMENTMKLPVFKGVGTEDLEQFWFVADTVWMAQQITNDNMKKAQLVTTLQDRELSWYIKLCTYKPTATMLETQQALNS